MKKLDRFIDQMNRIRELWEKDDMESILEINQIGFVGNEHAAILLLGAKEMYMNAKKHFQSLLPKGMEVIPFNEERNQHRFGLKLFIRWKTEEVAAIHFATKTIHITKSRLTYELHREKDAYFKARKRKDEATMLKQEKYIKQIEDVIASIETSLHAVFSPYGFEIIKEEK